MFMCMMESLDELMVTVSLSSAVGTEFMSRVSHTSFQKQVSRGNAARYLALLCMC